ncbi:winged helix-turn-helix domain-containing protein [Ralstonia sp. 25C]|uniref:winged helix-turn-helix domain-containing protein n=1 Tax=Ralstonia sp. 25C TaxID=3447363 RepID=UPI003F752BED
MKTLILLTERDSRESENLSSSLRACGYHVQRASSLVELSEILLGFSPDLLLMEWPRNEQVACHMLQALRTDAHTCDLPIIVLAGAGGTSTVAEALDAGADDYVVQPCDADELQARIRALLRRQVHHRNFEALHVNGLRLDPFTQSLTAELKEGRRAILLKPLEFRLLLFLVAHPERAYSRLQLLNRVWGAMFLGERTVDVCVRSLRLALVGTSCEDSIQTVRGRGYRWAAKAKLGVLVANNADTPQKSMSSQPAQA